MCLPLVLNYSRYKADINTLNQLLDSNEEAKLEEVKKLVQEIQELRRKSPEVRGTLSLKCICCAASAHHLIL